MKWYNKILRRLGDRRLLTHDEFEKLMLEQFRLTNPAFRIIPKRQHELLLDIAAISQLLNESVSKKTPRHRLSLIQQRLQSALMTYKIVEDDANIPPSTNAHEELHLMDIPGMNDELKNQMAIAAEVTLSDQSGPASDQSTEGHHEALGHQRRNLGD